MGKTIAGFTMSLDGFIAGPDDSIRRLFKWYGSGDTEFPVEGSGMKFKVSQASADYLKESWSQLEAFVTGRRDFDVSNAWGGKPPLDMAAFIMTHQVPEEWSKPGSPFTFITGSVENAVALAKKAAGEKNVIINGSQVTQQCLKAGLIDEIQIELASMLLGEGIRLFDNLGPNPIELENTRVIVGTDVTHLTFRVVK